MNGSDHLNLRHWIRNRDANAFKALTLKYSNMVYATCLRVTEDRTEAEDLTQECFETLASVQAVPGTPLAKSHTTNWTDQAKAPQLPPRKGAHEKVRLRG